MNFTRYKVDSTMAVRVWKSMERFKEQNYDLYFLYISVNSGYSRFRGVKYVSGKRQIRISSDYHLVMS